MGFLTVSSFQKVPITCCLSDRVHQEKKSGGQSTMSPDVTDVPRKEGTEKSSREGICFGGLWVGFLLTVKRFLSCDGKYSNRAQTAKNLRAVITILSLANSKNGQNSTLKCMYRQNSF